MAVEIVETKKIGSDFWSRTIFTICLLITAFSIIYSGPIGIMLSIIGIQVKCFSEIINIGYSVNKIPELPHFRLILWYLLLAANLFLYGENIASHFDVFMRKYYLIRLFFNYHRFISFCMYCSGIVWFVFSIVRKYRLQQYRILALTHVLLKVIVLQSYMTIENMFAGMIWFILPISLIVVNDISAYVFGRLFGCTPLIKVSPKKTWEGYIGGAICTVVFSVVFSNVLCNFKYFMCPIEYRDTISGIKMVSNCKASLYDFQLQKYSLRDYLPFEMEFEIFPFVVHAIALSLFASIIAPFGGFFASGFKRALKIKDFSDTIPGHGGFMDRFDCQYLMGTFVNVYLFTFSNIYLIRKLVQKITFLNDEAQLNFYFLLEKSLRSRNIL